MGEFEPFRINFIIISILAFMNCPYRSDYNLPLAIFAFTMWSDVQFCQKHRILWLLIITMFTDIIWLLVVSVGEWNDEGKSMTILRQFTQLLSLVNCLYKLVITVYAVCVI